MAKHFPLFILSVLCTYCSFSQGLDLGNILNFKGKYIKLGGGVSASSTFNQSNDPHLLRQPFTYIFNGNLNLQLMSWSVPVNFTYTNQKLSYGYSNPFKINRTAIHPKYKWVTLHVGDISMSLTPFTMNGLMFTGGGFDITPPKTNVKLTGFYGRFLKATVSDTVPIPTYERRGWGVKSDYTIKKHILSLAMFHARDLYPNPNRLYDAKNVTPQENLCLTFASQSAITRIMDVSLEYSTSILTRDTRSEMPTGIHNPLARLINGNVTTLSYTAFKTNVNINTSKRKITFGFEHIDPDYRSLGALYFNNDFENLTAGVTQGFFKKRLTLSITGGLQRDNLKNQKLRSSRRFVGSSNAMLVINKKTSLSLVYSSFQTFSTMRSQFDRINQPNLPVTIDTLQYIQLSNNATANLQRQIAQNKKTSQTLNVCLVWQKATDKEDGYVKQNSGNQIVNSNVAYSLQLLKPGVSLTGSFNATYIDMVLQKSMTLGPVVTCSYKNKKTGFNNTMNVICNQSYLDSKVTGRNIMARLGSTYTFKKKHNFGFNMSWQYRKQQSVRGNIQTKTLMGSMNYSYTF